MIKKYRDIQLIEKDQETYLAIACDVSASIGPKASDVVKVSNKIAGYYATAVTLIELLAIGAKPISVVDTLGVEMVHAGQEIIEGVKSAMEEAGIEKECLTGSTEDNIPTDTTSIGITVISELKKDLLKAYQPIGGQHVYLIGLPKMGQQFLEEEIVKRLGEVIDVPLVKKLRKNKAISHMLPVGSKGIAYELEVLLSMNDLLIDLVDEIHVDLAASAGPATCMLITCQPSFGIELSQLLDQPVAKLGQLV